MIDMPYSVGIAGGTGASKTTMVRTIVDRFRGWSLTARSFRRF